MSKEYDLYLEEHISNVKNAFEWLKLNIPELVEDHPFINFNVIYQHDESKHYLDEYEPYDNYFYKKERTDEVLDKFNKAWLLHIHRNPHHWQHWVLIQDDVPMPIGIEMPYVYILEMICDWWSFSFAKGDLSEIFSWYDEHRNKMILHPKTRETVENILAKIYDRLGYNTIAHHGVKGQKWGVRNGPPYPIEKSADNQLKNAAGKPIIKATHISLNGDPNTIVQVTTRNGGIERNYYDENGKQSKQICNNNHGNPKRHNFGEHGEHAHDYIYEKNGQVNRTNRELTEEERKENSDIL